MLTTERVHQGRSWTAPELRLKSFTELHQLWYILLRERNVLLTQREEARRLRVDLSGYTAVPDKLRLVRPRVPFSFFLSGLKGYCGRRYSHTRQHTVPEIDGADQASHLGTPARSAPSRPDPPREGSTRPSRTGRTRSQGRSGGRRPVGSVSIHGAS